MSMNALYGTTVVAGWSKVFVPPVSNGSFV